MKTPCGWIRDATPVIALLLGVLSVGCTKGSARPKVAATRVYQLNRLPADFAAQEKSKTLSSVPAPRPRSSQQGTTKAYQTDQARPEIVAHDEPTTPSSVPAPRRRPSQEPNSARPQGARVGRISFAALLSPSYQSIRDFLEEVYERISFAVLLPSTAKKLGPHVYFERIPQGDQRRVYVEATVCLREGEYGLEFLLCRKATKEYESVLQTKADARIIHLGLQATGATAGSPVQFDPVFKSPTGTPIKVTVRYADKGKIVTRPAQDWVRNVKTNKALAANWVFAGSSFYTDPEDPKKKPTYLATAEGNYISVANVPTAMLDLPFNSPKQLEGREFAPFTKRIPAVDTKVVLVLEPLRPDQKK